tara:strand:- start:463 stop:705 length:243 start_codon:yes stop_codon:yes gene_type:complete
MMVSNKRNTKLETDTMQITNEQFLELSADIAGAWLEDAYLDDIWQEDDNGDERYTDDAQDRFNDILDTVQDMLNDYVEVL